jgi:hypothetical protein
MPEGREQEVVNAGGLRQLLKQILLFEVVRQAHRGNTLLRL